MVTADREVHLVNQWIDESDVATLSADTKATVAWLKEQMH